MYNVEKYALQCIESIEAQNFRDFELIIVDDGSTDSTSEILEGAKKIYSNMVVIHKENGGLTSARKAAAEKAIGDYVFIIDGDDYIDADCLKQFADVITDCHPDVVVSGYKKTFSDGSFKEINAVPGNLCGLYIDNDINENVLTNIFSISTTVWAKAISRELYLSVQMKLYDSITMGEDGCIVYPVLSNAKSIFFLSKYPYYYRYNDESMTKSKKKYISWNSCLDRISFIEENLSLDKCHLEEQFSKYVIHACFNAVITQMRKERFLSVRRNAIEILTTDRIERYFKVRELYLSRNEKLMKLLLKYRMFLIIKIVSIIR